MTGEDFSGLYSCAETGPQHFVLCTGGLFMVLFCDPTQAMIACRRGLCYRSSPLFHGAACCRSNT